MKVIYHCYGSAHSSVVCASLHLGLLAPDELPSARALNSLPRFDRTRSHEIGTLIHMGTDAWGNEVYILGTGGARRIVERVMASLLDLYGIPRDELYLVNALDNVNLLTKIGGCLSRRFGIVRVGRPLVIRGIQRSFQGYVRIVEETMEGIGQTRRWS